MNNEFLKKLYELMEEFKEHHEDLYSVVEICKNSDREFLKYNAQTSDFKHELLEDVEYVTQISVGDSGDWFEGMLLQKIKGTDYCLLIEYSI